MSTRRNFFGLLGGMVSMQAVAQTPTVAPLSVDTILKAWTDTEGATVGLCNGTNKVFTLTHIPDPIRTFVHLNGLRQRGGGFDYTFSGNQTITFNTAPPSGSTIDIDCQGKFSS